MKMTDSTSLAMKVSLIIGIIITAIGLVLSETDIGNRIMWAGLLILIISPLIGVLATYVSLMNEKDWFWVKVTTILIMAITIGLIISTI